MMLRRLEQLEPRCLLSLTLFGTSGDDVFDAGPGWAKLNGVEYQADEIIFDGLGGNDVAQLFDSPGDDVFVARPNEAQMGGIQVTNCEEIHGYAKAGGNDVAQLYDSSGNDVFVTKTDWGKLYGDGFYLRAKFFETVEGYASEGIDVASLNDSAGDDLAHMRPGDVTIFGPEQGTKRAQAFDYVHAYARYGGHDVAHLYGERYTARGNYCRMFGEGYVNRAKLFEDVLANRERINAPTYEPVAGETITLVGIHILRRPIEIGSGTTLTGDATLTRPDRVQAAFTQAAQAGDTTIHVTSTTGFQVGDELLLSHGGENPRVIVAGLGPDWITFETPLARSYDLADGAVVVNYFPLIRAVGTNITIDGLTLDGNHDLSTQQWQLGGGGLIHMEATNSVIRNLTVVDAFSHGIVLLGGRDNLIENTTVLRSRGHGINLEKEIDTTVRFSTSSYSGYRITRAMGDGILVNGGANHLIENNTTNFNQRYGMHPAGILTTGGVWQNNSASGNRRNGFHFCYNNFDLLVVGNTLYRNRSGIAGFGLGGEWGDRFNVVTGNHASGNWRYGIETNGGGDNEITDNYVVGNGWGGILVVGDHFVSENVGNVAY